MIMEMKLIVGLKTSSDLDHFGLTLVCVSCYSDKGYFGLKRDKFVRVSTENGEDILDILRCENP